MYDDTSVRVNQMTRLDDLRRDAAVARALKQGHQPGRRPARGARPRALLASALRGLASRIDVERVERRPTTLA